MSEPLRRPGFDAAAERYDADEGDNPVLHHMRRRAERHLRASFPSGSRLIELGSGSGTEAARLAAAGCRIALVDVAPNLLRVAGAKVRAVNPTALLGTFEQPARSIASLTASFGSASFDGAYSSFGPLNCEPDLRPVFDGLGALVRPGGKIVISIINRHCPAEFAWFALHGQLREATRRWSGPVQAAAYPNGPKDVTTWYYSLAEMRSAAGDSFIEEHAEALPLLWPPPYLDFLVRRHPSGFAALEPAERWLAQRRGWRHFGDHTLVVWRRR